MKLNIKIYDILSKQPFKLQIYRMMKNLHILQNGDVTETALEAELSELRARLSEREKQLEKETAVNKHMSDRLASLGVAVAHS